MGPVAGQAVANLANLKLSQVATIFSKLINSADMGQRVDNWLFYLLFGLLVVALYGSNLSALGQNIVSLFTKTTGTGDIVQNISSLLLGSKPAPWTPKVYSSPLNPLPGTKLFAGIPLPQWVFMIGIFVWALGVMWEVFLMLREKGTLRVRSWEWIIAPVTLMAFVFSPELGTIFDKGLYGPIMTHFILGTQKSLGIANTTSIDPATFGNPMWILATMFGIGTSHGGFNPWGMLGNIAVNFWPTIVNFIQGIAQGDPLETISAILERVLNPSIIVEMVILFEAILLAFEGAVQILFFNLFPFVCIFMVANPFSLDRVWLFLKTALRVLAGLALLMTADLIVALINHWVIGAKPGMMTQMFGGWFLSFVNVIVLGVMILVINTVGVKPMWRLFYNVMQQVQVAGAHINQFIRQHGEQLPANVRALAQYGGNKIERAAGKLADYANPDEPSAPGSPYTMSESDQTVYEYDQPKWGQSVAFKSESTANQVWEALQSRVPANNSFKRRDNTITYSGRDQNENQLMRRILGDYGVGEQPKKEMSFENRVVAQRVSDRLNQGDENRPFQLDGNKITYAADNPELDQRAGAVLGDRQNLVKRAYVQPEKVIDFKNEETAEWVYKLLKNKGNMNKALSDFSAPTSDIPDGGFGLRGKRVVFAAGDENVQKVVTGVLSGIKTYRFVFGKYIDENGNAVPKEVAQRGIVL
ncbi:hypothetical protein CEB3_c18560 [Peptococcaceae bacterium CEB3]|nr:hypothetical protein CEB3_c18560 [Peptococcaceae bacterium CEB3]